MSIFLTIKKLIILTFLVKKTICCQFTFMAFFDICFARIENYIQNLHNKYIILIDIFNSPKYI